MIDTYREESEQIIEIYPYPCRHGYIEVYLPREKASAP